MRSAGALIAADPGITHGARCRQAGSTSNRPTQLAGTGRTAGPGSCTAAADLAASPPAPAAPRAAASRDGASPALWAHRGTASAAARACWVERVRALGFDTPDEYLAVRRAQNAAGHRGRTELGCGGSTAARLLAC